MHQIAEDVWQLPLMARNGINAYLLGDLLVDAGTKGHAKKIVSALGGRTIAAHAITHAHGDHVGGSERVIEALGIPFWCPAGEAADVEAGRPTVAETWAKPLMSAGAKIPSPPIARRLQEGDDVGAGFVVLDSPGHALGHVSFWRERDRVLICGDVFFHLQLPTLQVCLNDGPRIFSVDPELNRASQRKLAELRPEVAGFGHGPVLRDPAALAAYANRSG